MARPWIGRADDQARVGVGAVAERPLEQRVAGARALRGGCHRQQRQAPQPLAAIACATPMTRPSRSATNAPSGSVLTG